MYCIIIGLWNQFGVEQRCEQVLVFPLWLQVCLFYDTLSGETPNPQVTYRDAVCPDHPFLVTQGAASNCSEEREIYVDFTWNENWTEIQRTGESAADCDDEMFEAVKKLHIISSLAFSHWDAQRQVCIWLQPSIFPCAAPLSSIMCLNISVLNEVMGTLGNIWTAPLCILFQISLICHRVCLQPV